VMRGKNILGNIFLGNTEPNYFHSG
jgi:hypothetical protein